MNDYPKPHLVALFRGVRGNNPLIGVNTFPHEWRCLDEALEFWMAGAIDISLHVAVSKLGDRCEPWIWRERR